MTITTPATPSADALIAPVLLAGVTDLDELKVALGCTFTLDVFNIIQQEPSHRRSGTRLQRP